MAYVCIWLEFEPFVDNLSFLDQSYIAVYVSSWAVPMTIYALAFLLLAFGLVLKYFGVGKEPLFLRLFYMAIGLFFVALLVRLPVGFILDSHLEKKGYSYCSWYVPSGKVRPGVWVRSPEYCIEQAGVVRRPLMDWIQALPDSGRNVTPTEVRLKALEMLAAYEAGERFLD